MKKNNSTGNYNIYRQRHVTRHLAKHIFELDDHLYGTPLAKTETDWPLLRPKEYLQDLKEERETLKEMLGDMQCVLIEHKLLKEDYVIKVFSKEEANAHVPHKFKFRDFTYAEKISHLLRTMNPASISINPAKAMRQFNVLLAAIEDVDVSIVRFKSYIEDLESEAKEREE